MDNISKKVINGQALLPKEWKQLLLNFHKLNTGVTHEIFKKFKNQHGHNTYELICNEIKVASTKKIKILDIACGNGVISQYCLDKAKLNLEYIGIDISKHQIELAKSKYGRKNIEFRVEGSGEMSFNNLQFDYVVCHLAFMLLNPVDKTLNQIERVLKNNGYFIAIVNSRKVKDELLRKMMVLVGQFIKSKYPDFGIKNGGNSKTYDKDGLESLLKEFATLSKNIEVIELELEGRMTSIEFWEFLSSSYNLFCFPQNYVKELKEIVLKKLNNIKTEENYFKITYPFNLYKIQKIKDVNLLTE
ncbi:MAG: class I SAM-dependent methyltransferase [Saprospiraceae bacterium]